MQAETKHRHTHIHKQEKARATHLKKVLNMLVMPEFSGAAGGTAGVSELDGDEAGDVTEEEDE